MEGSEAWELYHNPPKILKVPNAPKSLDKHMEDLDKTFRKIEGRKPRNELTEREKIMEGIIPFNVQRIKQIDAEQAALQLI
ncbi:hypothetical protein MZD04_gp316 [Pseudomonas phage Psa21]|uniref:Uncharacterized protein n=1 Tax=Pseudomonas phage Psa21 TaxID=2530023 RepID=A0A481W565_9CAUD|nr:hypothetical protein MZD04_gp316 [Pseudomonas phage Psa21]QBJ02842.1 hypothetical protein PSA21_316 [Pseudomonas phage Psa21]